MSLKHELTLPSKAIDWDLISDDEVFGMFFCTTGRLSVLREEFNSLVTLLGGYPRDTVSAAVDYLVVPDGSPLTSAKARRAKELGVAVISESEFCGMIINY